MMIKHVNELIQYSIYLLDFSHLDTCMNANSFSSSNRSCWKALETSFSKTLTRINCIIVKIMNSNYCFFYRRVKFYKVLPNLQNLFNGAKIIKIDQNQCNFKGNHLQEIDSFVVRTICIALRDFSLNHRLVKVCKNRLISPVLDQRLRKSHHFLF